ncbi:MAG: hypothetical protein HY554_12215 [Elusimicrobia bacterium]|nr:hypothetical protein [Elusimicrobiota bacterium]
MLRALGEQLRMLAADPKNHYTSTLRLLTGPREAVRYGQPLRRMILALPDMIAQLRRWNDASGLPVRVVRLQRFALAYLYDPKDFLSAGRSGLFRYLDDAYLIAKIYAGSLAGRGGSGRRRHGDDPALAKSVPEWIELARRLLPKETAKIDALLDEVARNRSARAKRTARA